jgi:hypothetical protein
VIINNPLKYTDPTGNFFGIILGFISAVATQAVISAIGADDVQCGTQTPLSFSQPHLEGDGKVGDLHRKRQRFAMDTNS